MACAACRVLIVASIALMAACGQPSASPPTTPAPPAGSGRHATLTFHVYDSARGEIPSAAFTAVADNDLPALQIPLSRLGVANVDSLRAALYETHHGDRLGAFVTSTTNGTLTVAPPPSDGSYDLFLMSTAAGANYSDLDKWRSGVTASPRYATMRSAVAGEELSGRPVEAAPAESFQFVAAEFSRALNPFGLQYGRIDFVRAAPADISGGWVTIAPQTCEADGQGPGQFWLNSAYLGGLRDERCRGVAWYTPHFAGDPLIVHALAQAYLGAASNVYPCAFLSCPHETGFWFTDANPPLTLAGADAVRYFALMNAALR